MRITGCNLFGRKSRIASALVALFMLSSLLQAQVSGPDWPMFGGERMRTSWRSNETTLTVANVSGGSFGQVWASPLFDADPGGAPAHLFATPVYVDSVSISTAQNQGVFKVIFAATTAGFVYAVNAAQNGSVAPGTILWGLKLTTASNNGAIGGTLGVLSTPIVDTSASPPRIYVTSYDSTNGWEAFAVNINNGSILPGWPVFLNSHTAPTVQSVNQNGSGAGFQNGSQSQRGALNLSADGSVLYVDWGTYGDSGPGWLAAINTATPALVSSFSGSPNNATGAEGGMWGSGGPAIDPATGFVYDTAGNGGTADETTAGFWASSALSFQAGSTLKLNGTYTPFNYCNLDANDIDLGAGSPIVVPAITGTSTPNLISFVGKQGNVYLVNRGAMPGNLTVRQGCSTNAASDKSLLPPGNQPQFGTAGPLNVFGPYSESDGGGEHARSRSTPSYFQINGTNYIVATGATKSCATCTGNVPPTVARLKIVTAAGQPAYLAIDATEKTLSMVQAGTAVITSNGSSSPIVWVLDSDLSRSANPWTTSMHPILYALDGLDANLKPIWQTTATQLDLGGKFNSVASGNGMIFVGTDRIQAFGLTGSLPPPPQPPSNLTANAVSSSAINLSWTASPTSGVTYDVFRSTTSGFAPSSGNQIASLVSSTSYADSGLAASTTYFYLVEAANSGGTSTPSNQASATTQSGGGGGTMVIGINSGGPVVSPFVADVDFTGGATINHANTIDLSGVTNPAPMAVYQTARTGNFTYTIPGFTAGSSQTVRLHFAETFFTAAGSRTFNVSINGTQVLTNFDVFAAAGATNKAVIEQFTENANSTGQYVIQFTSVVNNSLVSGIEIDSATACTAPSAPSGLGATALSSSQINLSWTAGTSSCAVTSSVFRSTTSGFTPSSSNQIASGATGTSFSDTGLTASTTYFYLGEASNSGGTSAPSNQASATTQSGTTTAVQINSGGPAVSPFVADADFTGGGTISHANTIDLSGVTNPAPMAVYQTARTGNFSYTVPGFSAGSSHTVRLHFAETFFSTAGSRTFNVSINGTQVLTDFDIFATAGAKNKAVIEQFTVPASSAGNYVITFTSVVNQSLLSGIEIH